MNSLTDEFVLLRTNAIQQKRLQTGIDVLQEGSANQSWMSGQCQIWSWTL